MRWFHVEGEVAKRFGKSRLGVNFVPVKFAICNEIYGGWKLEDAMAHAKKTGYDAIEIAPFTLAKLVTDIPPERRMEIRFAAENMGLAITGIHWLLAHTEGFHLTHPEEEVRVRTARYLCDLVDFCADIGGANMIFGSPNQRNTLGGVPREQAWQWAKSTLHMAAARAQERNVTVCVEPLAPTETNFLNTAEETVRFVKQLNSPSFKVILDVKAMCSEARPIPEIIKASAPLLAHFHANDRNLKGPGFGDVDFKPIAAALKKARYTGYVSVEVFNFDEGPEVIASRSLEYLRSVFK